MLILSKAHAQEQLRMWHNLALSDTGQRTRESSMYFCDICNIRIGRRKTRDVLCSACRETITRLELIAHHEAGLLTTSVAANTEDGTFAFAVTPQRDHTLSPLHDAQGS